MLWSPAPVEILSLQFFYKNCKPITHLQFFSIWEQDPDNVNFLVKKKSIKPVLKNGLYIEWVVVWCIEWQCHEGLRGGNGEVFPLMSPYHHRSFLKFPPTQSMFQSAFKTNSNTDWITEKFIPEQGSEQVL